MTPQDFESQLRQLDRIGARVRRAAGRETWRFEYNDRPHYLHFYTRTGGKKGSAAKEFAALKALQELKIPAIRAIALLAGFTFAGRKGDAVITLGIEPAVRLNDSPLPHRERVQKIIAWLHGLRDAGLGHDDLRPESFIVNDRGELFLADATDLTQSGLSRVQLTTFAHNAEGTISTGDKTRAWKALVGDEYLPPSNRKALWKRDRRALEVQPFDAGEWKGEYFISPRPVPWSHASRAPASEADWQREWPRLLALLRADQLDILKRDASGDILAGTLPLGGRPIDFVLKRPREKYLYRAVLAVLRPSRARRLWDKTLLLIARKLPVEVPLLLMERRVMGRVVESLAIFERVPGPTLAAADLSAMQRAGERETFFRRCGKILRTIERSGLTHTDAKATNWIVFDNATDESGAGATPVLIDAYGIRKLTSFLELFGIRRLLRAMKQHPQYTVDDSLAICLGFAPRSLPLPEVMDAH